MNTYVLIHGAWHGAWCWERVVPLLQDRGHKVIAPDLPGHGQDQTPMAQLTLETYTDCVCDILRQQTSHVILVGHSMGGLVISQAAERCPDKIGVLVYLSAFLLKNGECLMDVAQADSGAEVVANSIISDDGKSMSIRPEAVPHLFYGDCADADVQWAMARLCPEAAVVPATPVKVSEENYHLVAREYIECSLDRAISIGMQRAMHTATPCRNVVTMQTSHSPFISAPQALVEHLLDASR